ncbi:MAG: hypothetical protein ACFN4D_06830, partial [Cardiobacterium sp.]
TPWHNVNGMPVSNRGLVVVSGIFCRASMPDPFVHGWFSGGASSTSSIKKSRRSGIFGGVLKCSVKDV